MSGKDAELHDLFKLLFQVHPWRSRGSCRSNRPPQAGLSRAVWRSGNASGAIAEINFVGLSSSASRSLMMRAIWNQVAAQRKTSCVTVHVLLTISSIPQRGQVRDWRAASVQRASTRLGSLGAFFSASLLSASSFWKDRHSPSSSWRSASSALQCLHSHPYPILKKWLVSFTEEGGVGCPASGFGKSPTPETRHPRPDSYRRMTPRRLSGASPKRTGMVIRLPLRRTPTLIVSPT